MEKGVQNGHFGKKANSPKMLSPRVRLHSSRKAQPRPTSTIPNYIGNGNVLLHQPMQFSNYSKPKIKCKYVNTNFSTEDSSDDDDFDPGRSRPHSNRYNNAYEYEQSPKRRPTPPQPVSTSTPSKPGASQDSAGEPTPMTVFSPSSQQPQLQQPGTAKTLSPPNKEILLSPKGLIL